MTVLKRMNISKLLIETSDKALISTLMTNMRSMKFDDTKGECEYIMKKRDIAAQLKSLEIEMSKPFLVHFILNSFPSEYGLFKIFYNKYKEKWSINELWPCMCKRKED